MPPNNRWSRSEKMTLAGLILAAVIPLFFPNVRIWLGLEKRSVVGSAGSSPDSQSSKVEGTVRGDSVSGNNVKGSGNITGNKNHVNTGPNIAIAPNGIANAAPNLGSQNVYNFGPPSRRFTQQQHDRLVAMLAGEHPMVIVWSAAADTDTWGLAEDIYHSMKDSGWSMKDPDVQAALGTTPSQTDVAIFLPGDPTRAVDSIPSTSPPGKLVLALKELGITFGMGHSDHLENAALKVVVMPR